MKFIEMKHRYMIREKSVWGYKLWLKNVAGYQKQWYF